MQMQYSLIDNAKYSEQSIYFSKSYLNIFQGYINLILNI